MFLSMYMCMPLCYLLLHEASLGGRACATVYVRVRQTCGGCFTLSLPPVLCLVDFVFPPSCVCPDCDIAHHAWRVSLLQAACSLSPLVEEEEERVNPPLQERTPLKPSTRTMLEWRKKILAPSGH